MDDALDEVIGGVLGLGRVRPQWLADLERVPRREVLPEFLEPRLQPESVEPGDRLLRPREVFGRVVDVGEDPVARLHLVRAEREHAHHVVAYECVEAEWVVVDLLE